MLKLALKPHHFVDIICSFGKGEREFEPHPYGHAVHTVSRQLIKTPQCRIQVETGADDICTPCIHLQRGVCVDEIDNSYRPQAPKSKQEWNLRIDQRWGKYMNIKQGDILDSNMLISKIKENSENLFIIYQEIPNEMIVNRKINLIKGLDFFQRLLD